MTDDDTVLHELREACAQHSAVHSAYDGMDGTDGATGGSAPTPSRRDLTRLYALRDEALSRGLPLPSSCPMDTAAARVGEAGGRDG